MAADRPLWHRPHVVRRHSLAKDFGSSLSEISQRDYPGKGYFDIPIPAIDLDSCEAARRTGNELHTIDAAIGVCHEQQGEPVAERLLLVELRMGYTTTKTLDVSDISHKDRHSRDILNSCPDMTPVDASLCLVFAPDMEQRALRWLSNTQKVIPETVTWLTFSPVTLTNHINAHASWPYTPKPETIELSTRLTATAATGNLRDFDAAFSVIKEYIALCSLRYERGECAYLTACMSKALSAFPANNLRTEDDKEYYDLITEDIQILIRRHSLPS